MSEPGASPDTASPRSILFLGALVVFLVALGGLGLVGYAWRALNHQEAVQETALAQRTMSAALKRMAAETASANSWDEAYAHTRGPIDLDWVDRHMGVYYASAFNHDFTLLFDSAGRPVFGALGGKPADLERYRSLATAVSPLVRDAQAKELRRRLGAEASSDSGAVVWFPAFVRDGRQVHILGVSTLAPNNGTAMGARPATVVVTGQTLDAGYLTALEHDMDLRRPALSMSKGGQLGSASLIGAAGEPVASIQWSVRKPGAEVLKRGGVWIAALAALLCVTIVALGGRIRQLFGRLRDHDLALRSTMSELIAARDKAQASSVAKSRFIANISHEVRTPLNGVLGMAQALARDDLAPVQAQRVETILRSGEGLLTVLNDLLDISKIEAGRMEISEAAFDLVELIEAACGSYVDVGAAKGLTLTSNVDPSLNGMWLGDPARIRQILLNLISNALKFTERGGVRVEARLEDDGVVISIDDDGIGVPAAKLDRLFEKFSQVDSSSTRKQGGTGLGLAISRELAVLMGGDIVVESRAGLGSRFSLTLPLCRAPAVDAAADSPSGLHLNAPLRPVRILAAEDNDTNRLVLKALLDPIGGELDMVADGAEAVERFAAGAYDLVLMDIQMPVMNGIDATRLIRLKETRENRPRTPILALTANTMAHHLAEYGAAGMDGHVPKPVQVATLYAAVFAALETGD